MHFSRTVLIHLLGLGAIADNVAGAKISVDAFLFQNFKHGVERVVVAVDVARIFRIARDRLQCGSKAVNSARFKHRLAWVNAFFQRQFPSPCGRGRTSVLARRVREKREF